MLSDFVTCRKRYNNQSGGGGLSQLWNTVGRFTLAQLVKASVSQ